MDSLIEIWIMSDLHQEFGEYSWRPETIAEHDVLVMAEDINLSAKASIDYEEGLTGKPVAMVAGNLVH